MINSSSSTLNASWVVYGEGVSDDDPAELYHEASTFYPTQLARQLAGVYLLETNRDLQLTSTRSTKRHPHVDAIALPPAPLPGASFATVVEGRRSASRFRAEPLPFVNVAAILRSAYGVTQRRTIEPGTEQTFRAVPSAGALFPLEVYCVAFRVDDLSPAIYHYDPVRDVLERIRAGDVRAELADALPMPELAQTCAVALVVTAMLWRSRFKYGQRGYRFALLEAGHLAQNVLLASEGLDLGSVPVGGFYDRRLAALLAIDGVNEVPLYVLPIGKKP
jgi:SagB-type dehydrogenase family enzyme